MNGNQIARLTTALAVIAAISTPAEAQRRFGGGGMHMSGGLRGGGFQGRTNFHAPGSGGGGIHNPSIPREGPPAPHPGGGGGGDRPGPHPGPLAALLQPPVQSIETLRLWDRLPQTVPCILDVLLDLAFLPPRGRIAELGFEQVVADHRQEAGC